MFIEMLFIKNTTPTILIARGKNISFKSLISLLSKMIKNSEF